MMKFTEWIKEEIETRGWSQNELARRAGLSSSGMSQTMTGLREPGPEFCIGVARALKIPTIVVYEQAGLLEPARGQMDITLRELYDLLKDMPVREQRAILDEARQRWQKAQPNGIEPVTN